MDKKPDEHKKMVDDAVVDPNVPKMYANGFAISVANADTLILFQLNTKPVLALNLSHTTAKTLAIKLAGMFQSFEKESPQKIMTTDELAGVIDSMSVPKEG